MITKEQILKANEVGLKGAFVSYYTPVLQTAYNLGYERIDLRDAEVISAFRFGKAPETFVSWNYTENRLEDGLSVYTEKSVIRNEFLDREKYEYTGIVSGTGSDGEKVILCFEADNLD